MIRYSRTNFYKQESVNGLQEFDLVKDGFELFKIKRPLTYYTLPSGYEQRPDLLSYALYGSTQYWWILAKFNNIDDCWYDIKVGDVLQVPDLKDIEDWYNAKRSKDNITG